MLREISKAKYELKVGDKTIEIVLSLGLKDELFRVVSEAYTDFAATSDTSGLISEELRDQYVQLIQEREAMAELTDIDALTTQINDLYKVIVSQAQEETFKRESEMRLLLVESINKFKYRVWACLLTERNLEGVVTNHVTEEVLKTDPMYAEPDVEEGLEKLLTVVIDLIDSRVKKTLATAKRVQEIGSSQTIQ